MPARCRQPREFLPRPCVIKRCAARIEADRKGFVIRSRACWIATRCGAECKSSDIVKNICVENPHLELVDPTGLVPQAVNMLKRSDIKNGEVAEVIRGRQILAVVAELEGIDATLMALEWIT